MTNKALALKQAEALVDTHGGLAKSYAAENLRKAREGGDPNSTRHARSVYRLIARRERMKIYTEIGLTALAAVPLSLLCTGIIALGRAGGPDALAMRDAVAMEGGLFFVSWFALWLARMMWRTVEAVPMVAGFAAAFLGGIALGGQIMEFSRSGRWTAHAFENLVHGLGWMRDSALSSAIWLPLPALLFLGGAIGGLWGRDYFFRRQLKRVLDKQKVK